MRIIVDAYGGDYAPRSVLEGATLAVKELDAEVTLVGNEADLREQAAQLQLSLDPFKIVEAETVMPVDVDPIEITGQYSKSSLAVALQMLAAGDGDAIVSAGSTGALVMGATLWVKRLKGVKRPAIGVVLPDTQKFHMMIDSGANSECRPEMLLQFGVMGSVYMTEILGVKNPRVAMVNIGTEPNKGQPLQIEASALLEQAPVNFIGNIEANRLPLGGCDVAVTDGFTGNIILKHTEGMAKMFGFELKEMLLSGTMSKVAALILKKSLKKMANKLNPSEYGGVPILGVSKPVIKAHGGSDALAIKNAIKQAKTVAEQDILGKIGTALANLKNQEQEDSNAGQ